MQKNCIIVDITGIIQIKIKVIIIKNISANIKSLVFYALDKLIPNPSQIPIIRIISKISAIQNIVNTIYDNILVCENLPLLLPYIQSQSL